MRQIDILETLRSEGPMNVTGILESLLLDNTARNRTVAYKRLRTLRTSGMVRRTDIGSDIVWEAVE